MSVLKLQQKLQAAGFDPGPLDGQWGHKTELALDAALGLDRTASLAWGNKLTDSQRLKVFKVCEQEQLIPDHLMSCMAFETGETFSPSVKNGAGSSGTGLIQFMSFTAKNLGTTVSALAAMSFEQQMDYVAKYFRPWRGRLKTLEDLYMAILWPAGIGKPDSYPLFKESEKPVHYQQNRGLDKNKDAVVSKAEAAAKVREKLVKGSQAPYVWIARK